MPAPASAEERAAEERRKKVELRIVTDQAIKEFRESIIKIVDRSTSTLPRT